ncbi:hypothetical protein AGLY_008491, partial [Aphis glycines]
MAYLDMNRPTTNFREGGKKDKQIAKSSHPRRFSVVCLHICMYNSSRRVGFMKPVIHISKATLFSFLPWTMKACLLLKIFFGKYPSCTDLEQLKEEEGLRRVDSTDFLPCRGGIPSNPLGARYFSCIESSSSASIEYLHGHSYRRIPNTFTSCQICIHMFFSPGFDYLDPFHSK